uniref:Uncharacterized protein n=1 Tax=Salix viminalis TaxID=40686 RepID=A0A6N2KNA6_SALVM
MAKKTRSLKKVMTGKDPSYPWKFSGIKRKRGLDFQFNIIDSSWSHCSCFHSLLLPSLQLLPHTSNQ